MTLGTRSCDHTNYERKCTSYKAGQSLTFYDRGDSWVWSGTQYFSWGGWGVGGPPRDSLMANYNKITGLVCLFSARMSIGRVAVIVATFCVVKAFLCYIFKPWHWLDSSHESVNKVNWRRHTFARCALRSSYFSWALFEFLSLGRGSTPPPPPPPNSQQNLKTFFFKRARILINILFIFFFFSS